MSKSIRFIAGVVCPQCGLSDVLRAGSSEDGQTLIRECVDCGYSDRLSQAVNNPKELATRVSRKPVKETSASPIRIIQPSNE